MSRVMLTASNRPLSLSYQNIRMGTYGPTHSFFWYDTDFWRIQSGLPADLKTRKNLKSGFLPKKPQFLQSDLKLNTYDQILGSLWLRAVFLDITDSILLNRQNQLQLFFTIKYSLTQYLQHEHVNNFFGRVHVIS